MKTVLLCGGLGSRLQEETINIPKPLVQIGDMPIIWHVMKIYEHWGFNDFILCGGYKFHMIKDFFYNYHRYKPNIKINTKNSDICYYNYAKENFNIDLIDTGVNTPTGGRLLKVKDYIDEDIFMLNYSDGISDVNINELIKFHKKHGKAVTLTSVQKDGKFGALQMTKNKIKSFIEKPKKDSWINGGFLVCSKKMFDYLLPSDLPFTFEILAKEGQLMAYKHTGDWECMDTLTDKGYLENLWKTDKAFWKVWE